MMRDMRGVFSTTSANRVRMLFASALPLLGDTVEVELGEENGGGGGGSDLHMR